MKLKTNIFMAITICTTLACTNSFAANPSASSSFSVSATLQSGIALNKIRDLTFPQQTAGAAATYVVAPADTTSASFSATGTPNTSALLTFGTTPVNLTCTLGTGNCTATSPVLPVSLFTCDQATCRYVFDATGKVSAMSFGATETVAANNVSGNYTGTQSITLTYQ